MNLRILEGLLGSPNPSANLIRVYQAYDEAHIILPVVALDDVFGIIAFGIAMSLAKLSISAETFSLFNMITEPLIEIGGSMILGLVLGLVLSYISKKTKGRDELQIFTLAFIGIGTGISNILGLSPLLTCIMIGATVVNILQNSKRVFESVNDFASPVYVLFFTLAGASLNLSVLSTVGLMGIAYVIARAFGKIFGAWVGAKAAKAEEVVTKNLGLALLPQGGISIGLIVIVRQQLPQYAVAISTIIMFSVLIYEATGPIFAKIAIERAGEIDGLNVKAKEKKLVKEKKLAKERLS